ncbi:hypothetical protein L6164_008239 [Bauhinia variegata]|uniref:Uncharacterized protein n=1 Tax=Bauhinia variegata TaxID=167791 RepID=A0ACB9PHJ0_BAUVA|nr:hypothetical protein L6164_008239 [Bauhinia variegata]
MSIDLTVPMTTYVDEDVSSGSGNDVSMLDGHKRQAGVPSSSGRRKRSRKATGDAIVDAMMEISAASKMRATAIIKNEDRFSISKCIKLLDEMQDTSTVLQTAEPTTPPEILSDDRFCPYFKDCIGVIDDMHIPAYVPAKDQSRFCHNKCAVLIFVLTLKTQIRIFLKFLKENVTLLIWDIQL